MDSLTSSIATGKPVSINPISCSVDKLMSHWYRQGEFWIEHGLPQYIAMKMANLACGRSGIIMRLNLVKMMDAENAYLQPDGDGLLHGTVMLKSLVLPWARTDRIVCADSHFTSVGDMQELKHNAGLRFIEVVKTPTQQYLQSFQSNLEMTNRGDRNRVIANDANGVPSMLAFCLMDHDCWRYL
jgi:hypothetical protein